MESIKLNNLMGLERLLLEIESKYKFDLSFKDVYNLHKYLKDVGKITSYFFLIQDEYYRKYNDAEKLEEYHDRLINEPIDFDYKEIVEFIERVINVYGDHISQSLVKNIKFW